MKIATNLRSQIGDIAFNYLLDRDWLYNQYIFLNKSTRQIALEINCGKKAILTALRRHNIEVGRIGVNKDKLKISINNFKRNAPIQAHDKINNKEWMYKNYMIDNKSMKEIAIELKMSCRSVRQWLIKHKIFKSDIQKQQCSARRYEQINGYKIGSIQACKKRMTGRRGERILTKKAGEIWCHSSWEKQVAEVLDSSEQVKIFMKDSIKIPYEFQNKRHLYFVDFLVIMVSGKIILIEVKAEKLIDDERTKNKLHVLNEYSNKMGYETLILTGKNKLDINRLYDFLTKIYRRRL